jgi:hypothetical protein
MDSLPKFDESSPDIPKGYGIEENHDGGWYPYRLVKEESYGQTLALPYYLKDEQGLDIRCATRSEALDVLQSRILASLLLIHLLYIILRSMLCLSQDRSH